MSHATYDIEVYQGAYFVRKIRLKSGDDYISLAGWEGAAQYRVAEDEGSSVAFTIAIDEDGTGWFVLVEMFEDQTALLEETGVWDLDLTDSVGRTHTYIKGRVEVILQVTR
jgi:hypothetical protein